MVIGWFGNGDLQELELRAEVIQKLIPIDVGLADIKVTSEVEWNIWMSIINILNYSRQLGQLLKKLAFFSESGKINGNMNTESRARRVEKNG